MISPKQHAGEQLLSQLIFDISNMCPSVETDMLRTKLSEIISAYQISFQEDLSINYDLKKKINLFLSAKKLEGLSKRTLYSYELELKFFARKANKSSDKISTTDLRVYLGQFPHLKQSSITRKLSILKSFFGWLVEEEIMAHNPARKIKLPKKERHLPKALTVEEMEMLREVCSTFRERAILEVLYATGCRLSEIYKLNHNDINRRSLSAKVMGKGSKEREVYFSFKAMYHLEKYLSSRQDECCFVWDGPQTT